MLLVQYRSLVRILAVTGCILLIPAVGMLVSDDWDWGFFDFVFAAVLLSGCGLLYELAARQTGDIAYRLPAALAVLGAFLLAWVNAAVGIIGDDNPAPALRRFGAAVPACAAQSGALFLAPVARNPAPPSVNDSSLSTLALRQHNPATQAVPHSQL